MDRNYGSDLVYSDGVVALRKESVDRNLVGSIDRAIDIMSLSARRAWIEIEDWLDAGSLSRSLSARRAWIEIKKNRSSVVVVRRRSPQGERG